MSAGSKQIEVKSITYRGKFLTRSKDKVYYKLRQGFYKSGAGLLQIGALIKNQCTTNFATLYSKTPAAVTRIPEFLKLNNIK